MKALLKAMILATAALAMALAAASPAAAQHPFNITLEEVAAVDTLAMHWRQIATSVGGVEGRLHYVVEGPSDGECRAVGVLGMVHLRDRYSGEAGERPVTLRLQIYCGMDVRGHVDYDGVTTTFELRNRATGQIVFQGRVRGLP